MKNSSNRTLVIGDCHGAHKALVQCLNRSNFDYNNDKLIVLGDVVDGWPETDKCFDELLKVKNLVFVRGNHDLWFLDFIRFEKTPGVWIEQGGKATLESYGYALPYVHSQNRVPIQHIKLLEESKYFYKDEQDRVFVHAGFSVYPIESDQPDNLIWNREFVSEVMRGRVPVKHYKEVYVGHTTTSQFSSVPVIRANVILMDQGGGFEGKLSILDIDTKEWWQSDKVSSLYKSHNGRNI